MFFLLIHLIPGVLIGALVFAEGAIGNKQDTQLKSVKRAVSSDRPKYIVKK